METGASFLNKPIITLLIHTESFLDDLDSLQYLYNASKYKDINIYFMPVINTKKTKIETGKYNHFKCNGFLETSISFSDWSSVICIHGKSNLNLSEAELDSLAEKSILSGEMASDVIDFIVSNNSPQNANNMLVVPLFKCKEILRLFLINKKEFLIRENFAIDETLYYIYRHKQKFSEFQNFWSAICDTGTIDDWADALDNRLNLLMRCVDYCKIECYKNQNNSSAMHLKYHMAYLMLLITGIFDNLAWLINNLYGLKLEHSPLKIDLIKRDFQLAIKRQSKTLGEFLETDYLNKNVKAIRKLRDRIVHRDFLKTVTERNNKNSIQKVRLFLDNELCELFESAGFSSLFISIKLIKESCIDILGFIEYIENIVITIVNEILKTIAKEIYDRKENICIWKLLELPSEPHII